MFWKSSVLLVITLYATWKRRAVLREKGFHAGFSALTFPTSSTAMTAIIYGKDFDRGFETYGVVFCLTTVAIISSVLIRSLFEGGRAAYKSRVEGKFSSI